MNLIDPRHSVTHRRVLAIALPMTLASATTPLIGVVGTAVIGRLGQPDLLGAVALASVVFDCLFWLFGFLRMSTVALTAQALGAGDIAEERATLIRGLMVATALGASLILIQTPLGYAIFRLMGASAEVTQAAQTYFFVRVWSAPFVFANLVTLGWLVGLAHAGIALALQIGINLINVAITALMVLRFGFGVSGAAVGAVVAEAVGTLAGLAIALCIVGARVPAMAHLLEPARLLRLLAINRDIVIRTMALIAAWGFFAAQGARQGDVLLAANAVLHNLMLVGTFFLDGFASAAEQLCGRATGARDRRAFGRAVRLALAWGFGFGSAATLTLLLLGPALIDLMTTSPEVRLIARGYLIYAAFAAVIGAFAFAYDGIFIGATWTRDMRNLMVAALLGYLAIWWLTRPLGNAGLWIAILAFFGARGLMQALRYPALARATFRPARARP